MFRVQFNLYAVLNHLFLNIFWCQFKSQSRLFLMVQLTISHLYSIPWYCGETNWYVLYEDNYIDIIPWRCMGDRRHYMNPWWRHQIETLSALLAFCGGESCGHRWIPFTKPVTRGFDVSLICARTNAMPNNRYGGDLRRHRSHYDVTAMQSWPKSLMQIFASPGSNMLGFLIRRGDVYRGVFLFKSLLQIITRYASKCVYITA